MRGAERIFGGSPEFHVVLAVIFGVKRRNVFGLYEYTIPKPFRRFPLKNPSQEPGVLSAPRPKDFPSLRDGNQKEDWAM